METPLLVRPYVAEMYDLVKVLRDQGTERWAKPRAWQIEFPIAMVVFGESEVGARREE